MLLQTGFSRKQSCFRPCAEGWLGAVVQEGARVGKEAYSWWQCKGSMSPVKLWRKLSLLAWVLFCKGLQAFHLGFDHDCLLFFLPGRLLTSRRGLLSAEGKFHTELTMRVAGLTAAGRTACFHQGTWETQHKICFSSDIKTSERNEGGGRAGRTILNILFFS